MARHCSLKLALRRCAAARSNRNCAACFTRFGSSLSTSGARVMAAMRFSVPATVDVWQSKHFFVFRMSGPSWKRETSALRRELVISWRQMKNAPAVGERIEVTEGLREDTEARDELRDSTEELRGTIEGLRDTEEGLRGTAEGLRGHIMNGW
ncbi:hypothetical protein EKO27_g3291 [Xylaria grammica]|uniref:Uncharacterized protein n=1 Tax=Xylaria grammica TaxID=363999 RepID=A0A439DBP9_9PEZI|nr:hypothetical protein EKO27_g3291 [Xylaria grammica]